MRNAFRWPGRRRAGTASRLGLVALLCSVAASGCESAVHGMPIDDTTSVVTPPGGTGNQTGVFMTDDFSRYTSTEQMLANPTDAYWPSESQVTNTYGRIVLDQGVGYGGSTKSMRYDYLDATAQGGSGTTGRCTNGGHGIMRGVRPPPNARRMWVEIYVRFSTNFSFGGSPSWGCTSGPETKLFLFGVTGPSSSRFDLQLTDGQWTFGYPDHEVDYVNVSSPRPTMLFDGQWHRIRFALGVSSAAGVADGMARFWVDDMLRGNFQNVVVNRSGFGPWYLGNTRNQGASGNMSMWIGKVTILTQNPGW